MAQEVETKVLEVDVEDIHARLEKLGAVKVFDDRLRVDWYRIQGVGEDDNPWYLRVRAYSDGQGEITWKGKSKQDTTVRSVEEIHIDDVDPEKAKSLFSAIELERYAFQEKDRMSWTFKNWRFDLDHYPGMPAFLEIEGSSQDHVREAMELLGIENHKTFVAGERKLVQDIYSLDWCHMKF